MNKPVKGGYTDKPAVEDDLNIERYIIDLTMADGTETEITAYNPFLVIDGAGYRTKYAPREALNSYANPSGAVGHCRGGPVPGARTAPGAVPRCPLLPAGPLHGLPARTDLLRHPGAVEGAALAATGWLPPPLTLLARAAVALAGGFRGRDRVHPLVARATAGVYAETPLCAGPPTTGLLREILRGLALVQRRRYLTRMDPAVPVLFLSGARDPLGWYGRGVRKTADRFRHAGVRDVTCRVYDGLRHELLLDPGREAVWADLLSWMASRVPEAENITSELQVRK